MDVCAGRRYRRWYESAREKGRDPRVNERATVLVTGADGFIGRHLVPYLAAQGYHVIAASRTAATIEAPNLTPALLPDISQPFDWQPLLEQCDSVVHLAGIAHSFAV